MRLDGASRGRQTLFKETLRRHKQGSLIKVEFHASPVISAGGQVKGLSCLYRELQGARAQITSCHMTWGALARLREREWQLALFIENAPARPELLIEDGFRKTRL